VNESSLDTPSPPEWGESQVTPGTRFKRFLGELIQTILIAGMLFLAVNLLTARIRVEGISMEPNLHEGQFVIVSRLAYRWETPERGDIIVFRFPLNPDRRFIKRVIGLPGDRISIQSGMLFVNDQQLNEPYLAVTPRYSGEWTIGQNEVFVLGDNRNNSSDSQNWGALPLENIIGKAFLIYWPPTEAGVIPHYDLALASQN
jgi:signal peptidase I